MQAKNFWNKFMDRLTRFPGANKKKQVNYLVSIPLLKIPECWPSILPEEASMATKHSKIPISAVQLTTAGRAGSESPCQNQAHPVALLEHGSVQ